MSHPGKKKKIGSQPLIPHQDKFQMDQRFKYKSWNNSRGNHGRIILEQKFFLWVNNPKENINKFY